ncbi:MAG: hypothetical protein J7L44_00050 [Candidatus Diapherotrites archaeon]|nr:hypothetical protein [Candidatus Diapherotrites archaeon]
MRFRVLVGRLKSLFRKRRKPAVERKKKLHEIFAPEVMERISLKNYGITQDILKKIAMLKRKGELIYNVSIKGDKIRYFRKYRRWVAPKGERIAIWQKPILIASSKKRPPKQRIIAARHDVYSIKAGRRARFVIARKFYRGVEYKPVCALREFICLVESLDRKVSVVSPLRVDVNWIENTASLYTKIERGFRDLSTYNLKQARNEVFIKKLAEEIANMHNKGIFHGDLRRPNILWNGSRIAPSIMLLDFETGMIFPKKVPLSKAIDDIMVLTESLCGRWQGLGQFTEREMRIFADVYCELTGYPKAK